MGSIKASDTGWQKGSGWERSTTRSSFNPKNSSPGLTIIMGIVAILTGSWLGLYSYIGNITETNIVSAGIQTTGTVIDTYYWERTITDSGSASSTYHHFIITTVEYSTADGSSYTLKEEVPIREDDYKSQSVNINVGDKITVYYDPDKPENGVVKEWITPPGMAFLVGGLFVIMGTISTAGGIKKLVKKKREAKE